MFRKFSIFLIALSVLVVVSCSDFKKAQKSADKRLKYKTALKYYNKGDYQRAVQLFDELLIYYRGSNTSEKINYYYSYCYYGMADYIQAGYYFLKFTTTFPTSKYTEECYFMSAYCQYLYSPDYHLDQTMSVDAIHQFQLFIDQYPVSTRIDSANKIIDELRSKLERKAFEIARLYLNIESYQAAVISFKNLLKEFPDTQYREQAYFYIVKASYLYAMHSIQNKKLDRFNLAVDAYNAFLTIYPESQYAKDARIIYKNITREIEKINSKKT